MSQLVFLFRLVALQKSIQQHSYRTARFYTDVFTGNFPLKIAILHRIASLRAQFYWQADIFVVILSRR